MTIPIREAIQSVGRFVLANPRTMGRLVAHAAGMRIAIPLDALRWLATHLLRGGKGPSDVVITARPPALALSATTKMMGQKLRVGCAITVEEIEAGLERLQVSIRVRDLEIHPFDPNSPLKQILESGALDLSKPAQLLQFMGGQQPKVIVSAEGDRFELDLLQIPAVASNPQIQRALRTLTPVVRVAGIRTDEDMLLLELRATPSGLGQALSGLRGG